MLTLEREDIMSYEKAMKFSRDPRKGKAQYMGFSTLGHNERRRTPWLGGVWFEPGMQDELKEYYREYEAETQRLLKENPNLKLI